VTVPGCVGLPKPEFGTVIVEGPAGLVAGTVTVKGASGEDAGTVTVDGPAGVDP
jgi:hypothetical protein